MIKNKCTECNELFSSDDPSTLYCSYGCFLTHSHREFVRKQDEWENS